MIPTSDLLHAQRTAEREEAVPYIDFPPTPAWYPPAGGLWSGTAVATVALTDTHNRLADGQPVVGGVSPPPPMSSRVGAGHST